MSRSPAGFEVLQDKWRLLDSREVDAGGPDLSARTITAGTGIPAMPATILKARVDAGVYDEDLYSGDALTRIEQDLWKRDWWYTLTFDAPAGHTRYTLQFDGLSYRAEIWLNRQLVAAETEVVGSWRRFEFDVSRIIRTDEPNHLAVRIIPERRTPSLVVTDLPTDGEPDGVDLADTWADWINFHHLGDAQGRQSFIPDKNSGIFRRVRLTYGGAVTVRRAYVHTQLPQLVGEPGEVGDEALLGVRADLRNFSDRRIHGELQGTVRRHGDTVARLAIPVTLPPRSELDVGLTGQDRIRVVNPDLWWPYTWGDPALYQLELSFTIDDDPTASDTAHLDFGIRQVTGHRDQTVAQPQFDDPGSFYLKINGRDYLVRGGAYSPDLLFESNDPARVRRVMEHAKDLGLNLLRWEGHLIDDGLLELCDREGMPAMIGTMCCGAWERWHQWDDKNHDTARRSIHDTVRAMRAHPAIVLWSNGSDGLPPDEVLGGYHRALASARWQNPVLDTVSTRNRDWSGVHMNGPYTWRSPAFWFMPDNPIATGSCAEEGNNEAVPLLLSVKKMLPAESLWPVNPMWSVHTGSMNSRMRVTRTVIDRRFGGAESIEEFVLKAQLAQYEGGRAQMEAYAARGWETNKFTVYWMMNSPWPSFFGHIFDAYWGKGGVYYGIKQALVPVTTTFDAFAEGDRETARIALVNQTPQRVDGLTVRVRVYRTDGSVVSDASADGLVAEPLTTGTALTLARPDASIGGIYFVRVTLTGAEGEILKDATYWQAAEHDVPNLRVINGILDAMLIRQFTWPDFSPLFEMAPARVDADVTEVPGTEADRRGFRIRLTNPTDQLAFFVRVELRHPDTQDEVLPSGYSDNFVTVYPGECTVITASIENEVLAGQDPQLHIEGVNL